MLRCATNLEREGKNGMLEKWVQGFMLTSSSNHKSRKIKVGFFDKRISKKIYVSNELEYTEKNCKKCLKFSPKGLTNMGVILSLSKVLKRTSSLLMTV
jgi:hypothetical protein